MARSLFSSAEITNGENCTTYNCHQRKTTNGNTAVVVVVVVVGGGLLGGCCCCSRHGIKILTLYHIEGEKDNI